MRNRKLFAVLSLVLALLIVLSACGTTPTETPDATNTPEATATPTEVPTATPTENPTETPVPTDEPVATPDPLDPNTLVDVGYLVDFDNENTFYLYSWESDESKQRKPYAYFDDDISTAQYWTDQWGDCWNEGFGASFALKEDVTLYGISLQNFCYGGTYDAEGNFVRLYDPECTIMWSLFGYDEDGNEYEIYTSVDQELLEPYWVENRVNPDRPGQNADTPFIQFTEPVQYSSYKLYVFDSSYINKLEDGSRTFTLGEVNLWAKADEAPAKQDDKIVSATVKKEEHENEKADYSVTDHASKEWFWGMPSKVITTDNTNTVLYNYEGEVDRDYELTMWAKYDEEYLYLSFVSVDMSPTNYTEEGDYYKGDGIQIRLTPNSATMNYDQYLDICLTRNKTGANEVSNAVLGGYYADKVEVVGEQYHNGSNPWKLHMFIKIKLSDLGLTAEPGTQIAFNLLRVVGNSTSNYAGWMAYGAFFAPDHTYNPGLTESNVIVFE